MPTFSQKLRRFPKLFDSLNRLNRLRHKTPLYQALLQHLPKGKPFTFLQIGANDGISHDPYREFMIRSNARGLAAEPVPEYFAQLTNNYRLYPNLTPINCAIGYPASTLPFHAYSPHYLETCTNAKELAGLASFDKSKLIAELRPDADPSSSIQTININVRTVEEVVAAHGFSNIDCIFMDCEGHEDNILTNLDFNHIQPKLISFEHTQHPDNARAIVLHLAKHGFACIQLSHDTVAHRNTH